MKRTILLIIASLAFSGIAAQASLPDYIYHSEKYIVPIKLNGKDLTDTQLSNAQKKYLPPLANVLQSPPWSLTLSRETYDGVEYEKVDEKVAKGIAIRWLGKRGVSAAPDSIISITIAKDRLKFRSKTPLSSSPKGLILQTRPESVDLNKLTKTLSEKTGLKFKISGYPQSESERILSFYKQEFSISRLGQKSTIEINMADHDGAIYSYLRESISKKPDIVSRDGVGKYRVTKQYWDEKKQTKSSIQKVLNDKLENLGADDKVFPLQNITIDDDGNKKVIKINYNKKFYKTRYSNATDIPKYVDGQLEYSGKVVTITTELLKEYWYEIRIESDIKANP